MTLLNKYIPTELNQIIGNEKKFQQLEKDIIKNKFKGKYLLHGKSSLGKTSFVNIISKKYKHILKKINILDIEKSVDLFNYSFFIKKILLIDEINTANLKTNQKKKITTNVKKLNDILNNDKNNLIILIADTKISEFKKIKDLNIYPLRKFNDKKLHPFIENIFIKEKIKYSNETKEQIFNNLITHSNSNITKIFLNIDAFILNNKKTIRDNEKNRNKIINSNQDVFINDTYDVLKQTFKDFDLNDPNDRMIKENLYYNEPFMVSNNIHQNYIKLINMKYKKDKLDKLTEVSSSLCDGDLIQKKLEQKKDYSLYPYSNYLNNIIPVYTLKGRYKTFFHFPAVVSKNTKILNNNKKLIELKKTSYSNFSSCDLSLIKQITKDKKLNFLN
jgi:hypothetical protein